MSLGINGKFKDHSSMRKIFRQIVLPVEKIKKIIISILAGIEIDSILDFGSGTFFWTDWFLAEFNCQMFAVDKYYEEKILLKDGVKCYWQLDDCFIV
jgi:hypothetical protein